MKLSRPLSANQIALIIAVSLVAVCYFKVGIVRVIEHRRLRVVPAYTFPNRELADLDHLLQVRFAVRPTNDFGMARIGPRHELFKPITAPKHKVIEALRRQNLDVVFYVAGANYLNGWRTGGGYSPPLQGPVFMTQKPPLIVKSTQTLDRHRYPKQTNFQTVKRPVDLPTEEQLNNSLGLMMLSSNPLDHTATSDGKTYRAGAWQVAAVPVRATDQVCVNCHFRFSNPRPSLGDPLGIALYAFRSTEGQSTETTSVALPPALPPAIPPQYYQ